MRLDQEGARYVMVGSLVYLALVVAVYLWLIDLVSMQRTFGAFLAVEFVALAMIVHVYLKPSFSEASRSWLLAGCAFMAALLLISL